MCAEPTSLASSLDASYQKLRLKDDTLSVYDILGKQLCQEPVANVAGYKQAVALGIGALKLMGRNVTILLQPDANLEQYDALLGDTACQIRAIFVAILHGERANFSLQSVLKEVCDLTKRLESELQDLQKIQNCNLCRQKTTIGKLLQSLGECELPPALVQLAKLFMLAESKHFRPNKYTCIDCGQDVDGFREVADASKLQCYFGELAVAKPNKVAKIIEKTKPELCHVALAFLQNKAKLACDPYTQKMICSENIRVIEGREEIPCYYSCISVLQIALHCNVAVLVKVKTTEHNVETSPESPFDAALFLTPEKDPTKAMIVIEAMRMSAKSREAYTAFLQQQDLHHLIALNAAHHSQYSDKGMLESVPLLTDDTEEMKRLQHLSQGALNKGCCKQNMELLCITHIFCDTLASQLKKGVRL